MNFVASDLIQCLSSQIRITIICANAMSPLNTVSPLILCFFSVSLNLAFASDYSNLTKSPELQAALAKLEAAHCYRAMAILNGQNPTKKPIRIMFRNLAVMGFGTCEAVTANTDKGLIIFIHSKHKNNAPEALACLKIGRAHV